MHSSSTSQPSPFSFNMTGVPSVLSPTASAGKRHLDSRSSVPNKIQWDFVESYLDTLTPSPPPRIPPSWLDSIDSFVLSTLLAKKRSELDIIRSDAQSVIPPRKDSGVGLPEYHVGVDNSGDPSPLQATAAAANSALQLQPASPRTRKLDQRVDRTPLRLDSVSLYARGNAHDGFKHDERLSPLSPTFGPRKGVVPSGTLKRRRTSVPIAGWLCDETPSTFLSQDHRPPQPSTNPGPDPEFQGVSANAKTEDRIIWEAAWTEIEKNMDNYMGKFMDARTCGRNGENQELWKQLIGLRLEKIELNSPFPYAG